MSDDGNVYLWTYAASTRNFAGWHLTADAAGCAALLAAVDKIPAGEATKLPTLPPTPAILAVPNNRRVAVRSAAQLTLSPPPEADGPDGWKLGEADGAVTLFVGADRLSPLRRGIVDVSRGRGDYSLGADYKRASRDERLWFWWMPRPSRRR